MDRTGTFRTTIMIESTERRGDMRTVDAALVDTGSEYTWVPREVLQQLGIRPEQLQRFVVADGRQLERELGTRSCTPPEHERPTSWSSPNRVT